MSEQSTELFRLVVEKVEDFAVYTKDLDGRVLGWNPGVERLLGYAEEEWVARPVSVIFTPEDLAQGALDWELKTALAEGRAEDQRWHVRKDGSRFWANGPLMLLRDNAGEPLASPSASRRSRRTRRTGCVSWGSGGGLTSSATPSSAAGCGTPSHTKGQSAPTTVGGDIVTRTYGAIVWLDRPENYCRAYSGFEGHPGGSAGQADSLPGESASGPPFHKEVFR